MLDIGSEVKPYGKVAAVGVTGGERYYWLIDRNDCVSMVPAATIELGYRPDLKAVVKHAIAPRWRGL